MSSIPTTEPTRFVSGDTVDWSVFEASYLSTDGWTVEYVFVSGGQQKTVTTVGQPDGSHLATIPTPSSSWPAGSYTWQKYAKKALERRTISSGQTVVDVDFATAATGFDARSHAQKALEAIEAVLEKRAASHHESYSIETPDGSRSVRSIPISELVVLRDRYRAEVARQKHAERLRKGLGGGKILTRMGGM